MFNIPDFYPTPGHVIDLMLEGEILTGKVVLEPSAGKGDLVDRLWTAGAAQVLTCEIDKDLRKIVQTKSQLIAEDCLKLTSDQVSHVDYIVMNPPFSNADEHILHMYAIAPPGCKIIALSNVETVKNPYSRRRTELSTLIERQGFWTPIGDAFTTAQRKTNVEVALIKMNKEGASYAQEFEGFFMEEDPEQEQANGLMGYNVVRDLVNRYVAAMKVFDQQIETAVRLNELTDLFSTRPEVAVTITRQDAPVTRSTYKKELQKSAWQYIFGEMNLTKLATRGLKEDINKFVETQSEIPFTMRNIYKMLEIVIATAGQRMDKAVLEVFDKFTQHHNENRHGVEGWQTNSHYLLNRRFIVGSYLTDPEWNGKVHIRYGNTGSIDDLQKALCFLTATPFDEQKEFYAHVRDAKEPIEWGQWFEWSFFRCRAYAISSNCLAIQTELENGRIASLTLYKIDEQLVKVESFLGKVKGEPET